MFVSGLSRIALEACVGGKGGYADGRDIVRLATNLDINSFRCSHYWVRLLSTYQSLIGGMVWK